MKVATLEDLEAVKEMALDFIDSTYFSEFSHGDTVEELLKGILTGDGTQSVVILEEGKGMIVGIATPFLYGPHKVASELGWYVYPNERKSKLGSELLAAFEYWAKEKAGCTMIVMGSLNDKLDKFYIDKGYKTHEKSYIKIV